MTGHRYRHPFDGSMTLDEARSLLVTRAAEGEKCPCCTRNVKVYRRALTSVAARAVAALYIEHGLTFGRMAEVARQHLPEVASQGGYLVLGQHWNLIESEQLARGDVGRTGFWRVTDEGEAWLHGESTVPKYAHLFQGVCVALAGDLIGRAQALDEHFDFAQLMARRVARGQTQPLFDVLDRKAA